jgi:GTPase SAR1 family protein
LMRFNDNHFIKNQKTTIGVDYKAKEIDIDGDAVKLQVINAVVNS